MRVLPAFHRRVVFRKQTRLHRVTTVIIQAAILRESVILYSAHIDAETAEESSPVRTVQCLGKCREGQSIKGTIPGGKVDPRLAGCS